MADPYISEFKAANESSVSNSAKDFIEIVVDTGTDVSDLFVIIYKGGATNFRYQYSLLGKDPTQTLAGKDVYLIDNQIDGFAMLANDGAALVKVNNTASYPIQATDIDVIYQAITDGVGFTGSGDGLDGVIFQDVTPGAVQAVPSTEATDTLDGGQTYSINSSYTPGAILCFNSGTFISTVEGEVTVDKLELSDQVLTMDDGYQPLRWVGSVTLEPAYLELNPRLKPICIRAGALGDGFPAQDLIVSPQHRVLVRSRIAERMFGNLEVLIPAKKLLSLSGVDIQHDNPSGVRYFHLMFDKHQIVYSNGLPTETLFTGPMALKSLSSESRLEIQTLFPEICNTGYLPKPARPMLESRKLVRKLVFRHQKNSKPMFA